MKKVGVIGVGRMGLPIVGHLVKAGYSVLAHDVNSEKKQFVEKSGANWVESVEEIGSECEVILICVGFDREVEELLLGSTNLLARMQQDAIVAVLSTISPKTVQRLSAKGSEFGVHIVDSTVCRGGEAADNGTLLSFIGGTQDVVDRLQPIVGSYSSDVVHSGGVGTAQVSKAVNNLILWACLVADHEGLALAKRYCVEIQALRAALLTSSSTNGALDNWGKQTMAWAQDDMAIVMEMADECGISLPQAGVTREICRTLKPKRYHLEEYGI